MNKLITTQTNLRRNTKKYDDAQLFKGILALDNGNIGQFNPAISGYGTFWWVVMPKFMELGNKELSDRFKNYTEKAHTSFEGIDDLQMDTDDVTGGVAGNAFKVATNMKDNFDTFTIKVYEMLGATVREPLTYWANGIRDHKSGYAHYNGLIEDGVLEYDAENHTAELLYVVTDPSGSSKGVEYACLITNIVPLKIPKNHLNITHGDHNVISFDLEFSGVKYESEEINEIAVQMVAKKKIVEHYMDYKMKNKITV